MKRLPLPELVIFAAFMIAGCAALPGDPSKMTPEQLSAWSKDRNAALNCISYSSMVTETTMRSLVLDRGILHYGKITIEDKCKMIIENALQSPPR